MSSGLNEVKHESRRWLDLKKPMNRTRKIVVTIWVLLGLSLLTLLDWQFGGLRFTRSGLNVVPGLAAILLPTVCLILLCFVPPSRARLWAFVGLIPGAPFCFILGGILVLGQIFSSYTQQASVQLGPSRIVTYFEDAGAWDNGEVVVQQEIVILPGLLWMKPLSRQECLRDVQIRVVNRHYVECDYPADTADKGDPSPDAKQDKAWVF